ncbi:hypothetical protein [Nocardia sp. NPDC057353]|uniref:hypothetical protein n=1 Tax=Nocardia sp. NPDC057353 TaxID=3346104 RepID=UPI0036325456
MGFGVNCYVVDLDYARGVLGSGNDEVLRLVESECAHELARDADVARAVRLPITGKSGVADIEEHTLSAGTLVFEALSVHQACQAPLGIDWRDE